VFPLPLWERVRVRGKDIMFKGFIFDLDGTVYLSDHLIPGADEVIRLLRENGKKVVFLSNKPLQTREDYASKLAQHVF